MKELFPAALADPTQVTVGRLGAGQRVCTNKVPGSEDDKVGVTKRKHGSGRPKM